LDDSYPTMLDDAVRMEALRAGLAAALRPGDVVVDIGCAMGACCVYAAQLGASAVYGIECERIVDVARETAARSGYADRIQFFEAYSTDVTLPQLADVAFFEDFSSFLVHRGLDEILADTRARLLKPGGRIVPGAARIFAAPFEDPDFVARVDPWGADIHHLHGLDFAPIREMRLNSTTFHSLEPEQLLAEPVLLRDLDLQHETDSSIAREVRFESRRAGTAHGLAVWFDLEFAPGVGLSNAPGAPVTVWEQGALPLESAVALAAGDPLWADIRTVRSDEYGYFWNWTVRTAPGADGLPLILRQSNFRGDPLPLELAHALTFRN
jgi:protein arginine N-methyltransferase 1